MLEFLEATIKTVNHQLVKQVYIFYENVKLKTVLNMGAIGENYHKITFIGNPDDTVDHLFRFANEHLVGEIVNIMNADVYPGEGWENLDPVCIRKNKVMYGLAR